MCNSCTETQLKTCAGDTQLQLAKSLGHGEGEGPMQTRGYKKAAAFLPPTCPAAVCSPRYLHFEVSILLFGIACLKADVCAQFHLFCELLECRSGGYVVQGSS